MKINLGSGDTKYEGFINIDFDIRSNPDYCINIETEILPFEDNTVDEVIAHHVLEHLGDGYFHVLKELYRVCKNGALIDIRVPHPRHYTFLDDPTHKRAITVNGLRLFSKKYNDFCKEQGNPSSRLGHFYNVDFEIYKSLEVPEDEYIEMFNGKPVLEVERYMRERNNVIIETHVTLIVVKNDQ